MNTPQVVALCHKSAKDKGFWEKKRNTGELLMLIVSELAEALEADRASRHCEVDIKEVYDVLDRDVFIRDFKAGVKDTFEDEIADAVIRIFDLCGGHKIDLENYLMAKLRYNASRPHKHGKRY